MELEKTKMVTPVAKSIFGVLKEARNLYGEHRVKLFLATIDSEVENMSVNHQAEINEFLNQKQSKKVLADYADAITNTSSEIVLRALALLFISDRQFDFSDQEKARFVACTNGLDDLKVNLFVKLSGLKKTGSDTVYPTYKISHLKFDSLNLGVEIDELFAYTEDLFKRGLLLRDPRGDLGSNFYAPKDSEWLIYFGISSTLQRYAALFRKAKFLAGESAS
ncbi:hypothetical protein [Marinobacter lipolyticus]|uniref:hypothetical protein n=1 Tax=Marinobacter lipolyticus TaxID=209639 RepID=UPI003A95165E